MNQKYVMLNNTRTIFPTSDDTCNLRNDSSLSVE